MNRIFVTGGSGFIGTNLIESFEEDGVETINYDLKPPLSLATRRFHVQGDVRDSKRLEGVVADFKPDAVIHLAARCDLAGMTLKDYDTNTDGVRNVIAAVKAMPSIRRTVFTSSRYVHANEVQPRRDDDYSPFTMYGASKVEGEKIVRQSDLDTTWLIIRPTSIWGPWFDIPYKGFFQAVQKGFYVHPAGERIYKSYGYVGNVIHQIRRFLDASVEDIGGRMFYVADYTPIEVRAMAERIREEFSAPKVREVPLALMKPLAAAGDVMKKCGWYNPPLSSFRLSNLRCQMVYDLSRTADVCGAVPWSMEDGIARTVEWMKENRKWSPTN